MPSLGVCRKKTQPFHRYWTHYGNVLRGLCTNSWPSTWSESCNLHHLCRCGTEALKWLLYATHLGSDRVKALTTGIWTDSPCFSNLLRFCASERGSCRPAQTSPGLCWLALPSVAAGRFIWGLSWLVPNHQVCYLRRERSWEHREWHTDVVKDSIGWNAHVQKTHRCFKACNV